MANSMKRPPMQKQAERLAEQGRFGDSMLVHMNPEEVEGIASLVPGGLTINPKTGQPEAWLNFVLQAIPAIAGAVSSRNQAKKAGEQTAQMSQRFSDFDKFGASILPQAAQSGTYQIPKTLEERNYQASFLPSGTPTGINVDYQRTPGTMFANYPSNNPFAMGALPKRVVQQPVMQEPPAEDDAGGGTVATIPADDLGGMAPDFDDLEMINASRVEQGLPPFESIEDFYDFVSDQYEGGPNSWLGPMVANEGGLASLPVYMNIGGIAPRSAFQRSGDRRSLSSRVPGMRRMAMRNLKATSPESGDAQAIPQDQDVITEIPVNQEQAEEAAKKLAQTGMPLSKRLERQMRRADRREARRQRKADRIAARNDPGGYEQVVSKFAPKQPVRPTDTSADTSKSQGRDPATFWGAQDYIKNRIEGNTGQQLANAAEWAIAPGAQLFTRVMRHHAVPWLRSLFKRGGPQGRNQGGIISLPGYAHGDMVEDFPRMNGPISGPGTEVSDDIPAMLSDGEFVVNAKAVRGIGRLNGANKSKADQRREGARMMYALQNAGEQAIRRNS